ncbi:MAG: hypothetical protein RBS42_04715, partial [Campylobacterales bacterium]|nr:hypothetical protein [Campylobacterales bacterium]
YGGIGNATYLFGKDDGDDLIVCGVGKSSILFDEEIEKESVFIASKDDNLFIQYSDEGSIVVKNHKRLKSISLNDGSYITSNDINRIIQEMNSFAASNDLDITNVNEMKNSDEFMQIVMSGWR